MGRDIQTTEFTREDRMRFRDKVKANLAALHQLVDEGRFESGKRRAGLEMEVYLIDGHDGRVRPLNAEVLQRLPKEKFQTELAQFNLEFATDPTPLHGGCFTTLEADLFDSLQRVRAVAAELDTEVAIIGILPTLSDFDATEDKLSANPRYRALNDTILNARGEDILIRIEGEEVLETTTSSILFEAACTSLQMHLQVDPDDFATYWNAAQALSGPLVAVAANSPFFLGKTLHHETRITLFQQSIDTRTEELQSQGVRPRVWFGEKWITGGLFELFDENVRYFPSLLPICEEEDPLAILRTGDVPKLPELTLHNGTIYRWNRPVYEVARGKPHMRIENRVLPAGPTLIDGMANVAFYYGMLAGLVAQEVPIWKQMSFDAAADNFYTAARDGIDAHLFWPRHGGDVPVTELVVRVLLPLARRGLERWDVDRKDIDRLLEVIEQRVLTGRNGASWQVETFRHLRDDRDMDPHDAIVELTRRYQELSSSGQPVHTWDR
jgi:gamma-glutamyl:cysteine ligase YbdK (ATP-grasp superfamily)